MVASMVCPIIYYSDYGRLVFDEITGYGDLVSEEKVNAQNRDSGNTLLACGLKVGLRAIRPSRIPSISRGVK